jgi:hypothetical protein
MKPHFYRLYKRRVNRVDRIIFHSLVLASDCLSNAMHLISDEELQFVLKQAITTCRRKASIHSSQVLRDCLLARTIMEPAPCSEFSNESKESQSLGSQVPDWITIPRVCNLPGHHKSERIFRAPNLTSRRACVHLYVAWKKSGCEEMIFQALKYACLAVFYIERARRRRILLEKSPCYPTLSKTPLPVNGCLFLAEEQSLIHM